VIFKKFITNELFILIDWTDQSIDNQTQMMGIIEKEKLGVRIKRKRKKNSDIKRRKREKRFKKISQVIILLPLNQIMCMYLYVFFCFYLSNNVSAIGPQVVF